MISRRRESPQHAVVDHNLVRPKIMEQGDVKCTKGSQDGGRTTSLGRADVAVGNDAVLESCRILNGSKTVCWLPAHSFEPAFKHIKQGPTG